MGDALGSARITAPLWAATAAGLVAAAAFLCRRELLGTTLALVAIWAAASWSADRVVAPPPDALSVSRFGDGVRVALEGRIARPPERLPDRVYLFIDVARGALWGAPPEPARGVVRITAVKPPEVGLGDEVRVGGELRLPRNFGDPGEFDYRAYLLRNGIVATMVAAGRGARAFSIEVIGHREEFPESEIEAIRERIGALIDLSLTGPARAEMRALLIGDRGGIDRRLRERFAMTGMAHMLVISGLHLGLVAAAAFALVRLLCGLVPTLMARGYANKLGAACAALAAGAYAAVAEPHVSTMRALVMVLAYALAVMADRAREVLASLALAALVVCLALPGSTADLGFQLSFASVLVIVLGMRRWAAWWRARRRMRVAPGEPLPLVDRAAMLVGGYVAVSFWALLGTAPLTAYHFNQFATVGIVANALVVPIMGLGGMVFGLCGAVAGFLSRPLGMLMLKGAGCFLRAGTWLVGWFYRWPLGHFRIFTPTVLELAIVYGLLLLWLSRPAVDASEVGAGRGGVLPQRREGRAIIGFGGARWRRAATVALAAAMLIDAAWWIRDRYFNPDLRVTFLSVGEGDAAVVRFPGSRVMLIDAGPSYRDGFDLGERVVAPYLWSRKIMHVDYLALSHPDLDHFGGFLFIVENFSPTEFWRTSTESADASYRRLTDALAEARVPMREIDSSRAPLGIGGATVAFLGPRPDSGLSHNNLSMVLKVALGPTSFLFPGDIEAPAERALVDSAGVRATVLKVPHHGSRTSSTAAFIDAVHPVVAVMSLGYRNPFHFPAPEVVARYAAAAVRLLRTDRDGAVMVDAAPNGYALTTWREANTIEPKEPEYPGSNAR